MRNRSDILRDLKKLTEELEQTDELLRKEKNIADFGKDNVLWTNGYVYEVIIDNKFFLVCDQTDRWVGKMVPVTAELRELINAYKKTGGYKALCEVEDFIDNANDEQEICANTKYDFLYRNYYDSWCNEK